VRDDERSAGPYVALFVVQLLFGSLPVIAKIILPVIPPVALVGFRIGVTALALVIFQSLRGNCRLKEKGDYWKLAVLSLFGITFNQLLFVTGLSLTKAANTSLLAVTIPIFTITVGSLIGTETLRRYKVLGIVLAAIGVVLIINPQRAAFSAETTMGDALIVLNSLSFGIYVATSKSVVTRNGAFRSMMWVFVFASLVCVPLGLWSFASIESLAITPLIWLLMLHIALMATAVPYLLNAWALARVDPSTLAVFIYLQPLIGFLLAAAFLGEQIDATFIAAAALIFAGVFLVSKKFTQIET
jgi:drug/metabolite transporter (DMT)-like permease